MCPSHIVAARDFGRQAIRAARLPEGIAATCLAALARPGRLFRATPVWARLFLAWSDALAVTPIEAVLPAVVACEFMVAGYDLIDAHDDGVWAQGTAPPHALPAGICVLLLAQELLARLDLPAERRLRAATALARAGRRALAGHAQDLALRQAPTAAPDAVLGVLHLSRAAACIRWPV